jgi:hypothetical protein
MKGKIKQFLNQDSQTRILDFGGGNGKSIPMLIEIAGEHLAPIEVTIIDRRSAAIAEQLLLDNGFTQDGNSFQKDNLKFNIISNPEYLMQAIYSSGQFDLSFAFGDKISTIAPQKLRNDVIQGITDVSKKMILCFKAEDNYVDELKFARSRGYEQGEIIANGADGLQTCGVYDESQVRNILTAVGAKDLEIFREGQHPAAEIITCVASCFNAKTIGVVANGKAVELAGNVNQMTR